MFMYLTLSAAFKTSAIKASTLGGGGKAHPARHLFPLEIVSVIQFSINFYFVYTEL